MKLTTTLALIAATAFVSGSAHAQYQERSGRTSDGHQYKMLVPSPNSSGRQNYNSGFSNNSFSNSQRYAPVQRPYYSPNTSGRTNYNSGFSNSTSFNSYPSYNTYRPSYSVPSYSSNSYRPSYSTPSYSTPSYSEPPRQYYSGAPIQLSCPSWSQGTCRYRLISASGNAYDYTIHAGQSQSFRETTKWRIQYDQGQGLGYQTYSLSGGGNYRLQRNSNGTWSLHTIN